MSTEQESINVHDIQIKSLNSGSSSVTESPNADMETEKVIGDLGQKEEEETTEVIEQEGDGSTVMKKDDILSANEVVVQHEDPNCDSKRQDVKESDLSFFTTKRDGAVKLAIAENSSSIAGDAPVTVMQHVDKIVKEYPNVPALKEERNGQWVTWTYSEYYQDILVAAKAFIELGLEPYNGVGIIGFNSPEWLISDIGCIYACGLTTGIYATNTPETCLFVASDAKINIVVAENDAQVQKFLGIWDKMPFLKAIIQYKGDLKEKRENVYSWNEFMEIGRKADNTKLNERIAMQMPNKCCTLIYTSGTTGNPKGVMLSHDNITFSAKLLSKTVGKFLEEHVERNVVSYLPLSHIAAQMVDIYGAITFHSTVYFAKPDALKGSLGETLRTVRPTIFLGVPRVFEKIEEKLKHIGESITGIRKKIGTWAKGVALKANINREKGVSAPFGYMIADKILKKVKVQLGLDRCLVYTSAAPISLETLRYFQSINIPLMEIYGMSECTGCATMSLPKSIKTTSVGKPLSDVETEIFNKDQDGSGEICMRGRFVLMGYLENEEKTTEAIDEDGWLHSGDLGKFDEDGFLHITGRIKELIITAGGENIAPVPIEDQIKAEIPFISNAMVIGDRRKFLSAILTPKVVMDESTGGPTSKLAQPSISYCQTIGLDVTDITEIAPSTPEILDKEIKAGITRANQYAVSRAGTVQKYVLLPTDFSIQTGELGPTLKLRRPHVMKMYNETIDKIYESI